MQLSRKMQTSRKIIVVTTSKETYLDGPTVDSILCLSNTPKVQVVVFEVEKKAKKNSKILSFAV